MTVVGRRRGRQSGDWRSRECGAKRLELAGGGFAVFADEGDEGLGGEGQDAVAAVDETEFAPDPAGN
jgi:hypothetical protein